MHLLLFHALFDYNINTCVHFHNTSRLEVMICDIDVHARDHVGVDRVRHRYGRNQKEHCNLLSRAFSRAVPPCFIIIFFVMNLHS